MLSENRSRRKSKITVPEPEIAMEQKFKCPLNQQIHDNSKGYEAHRKEEHDVL